MTEINFHFNVPDRLLYACRLLRKACRKDARVVVLGSASTLTELDRALWSFDAHEFLPHRRLARGSGLPPMQLAITPIWLIETVADAPDREVLLNLEPEVPTGFDTFARVVEIVSTDPQERARARERWKHYAGQGCTIESHEVAA